MRIKRNLKPRKPDVNDEPVLVPPDVEDHAPCAEDARAAVSGLDVCRRVPAGGARFRVPGPERPFCIVMASLLPEGA